MGHPITEAFAPSIGLADIPVYRTAPLALDGDLSKPTWQRARRVPICYEYLTDHAGVSPEATAYYMVAWDARFLYVAYDWTSSARPVSATSGEISGPPDNRRQMVLLNGTKQMDCFEFFVDMNYDEHHFWELHHNDRNDFTDIFCIRPRNGDDKLRLAMEHPGFPALLLRHCYIRDDGEFKLATAVRPKVDAAGRYAGYSAELRLPLLGLHVDNARRSAHGYDLNEHRFRLFGAESRSGKQPFYFHSMKGVRNGWFHHALPHANRFIAMSEIC